MAIFIKPLNPYEEQILTSRSKLYAPSSIVYKRLQTLLLSHQRMKTSEIGRYLSLPPATVLSWIKRANREGLGDWLEVERIISRPVLKESEESISPEFSQPQVEEEGRTVGGKWERSALKPELPNKPVGPALSNSQFYPAGPEPKVETGESSSLASGTLEVEVARDREVYESTGLFGRPRLYARQPTSPERQLAQHLATLYARNRLLMTRLEAIELSNQGLCARQIAERLGVSSVRVRVWLNRFNEFGMEAIETEADKLWLRKQMHLSKVKNAQTEAGAEKDNVQIYTSVNDQKAS